MSSKDIAALCTLCGIVLGVFASVVLIQLGREAAPPLLPSCPPTEVHPS